MFHELLFEKRDYEQLHLSANPFSSIGIPRDEVNIYVERDNEMQLLIKTISISLRGGSGHAIVIGSYGNGKTHTLRYLKSQINSERTDSSPKALAIYVNTPGDSLRALLGAIMFEFGRERMEHMAWEILQAIAIQTLLEAPSKITKGAKINSICKRLQKKLAIIKLVEEGEILLQPLMEEAKRRLTSQIPSLDFITAFLHLVMPDYSFLAWKWLCAENIPSNLRTIIGMTSSISDDQKALMTFLSLRNILTNLGYDLFVILIDELEALEALEPRKKQRLLNELRHLIDISPEGLSIIVACAPEIWQSLFADYHAFSDRFLHEVVLRPLDYGSSKKIIAEYLSTCRIGSVNSVIFPFTENAIKIITSSAQGNVRRVIKTCYLAIEAAIDSGINEIDSKLVQGVINQISSPWLAKRE